MRRTAVMVLGFCLATMLAGVAPASVPASAGRAIDRGPAGPADISGREEIGTVEQVDQTLSYVGPARSRTFHYSGAPYVKVHLTPILLLRGDYLTVAARS